jgi:dihydrosphingosine 1-phosphate phosphatase
VFFSGFFKDLLCLPRPLSPPLQRVTMSGSAALEYGFPSTHSTNAVSVAVYCVLILHSPETAIHPTTHLLLELLSYGYATSIVIGRLYCGMHGFFDVIVGSLLGALLALIQWTCADTFDRYLYSGDWTAPLMIAIVVIVLVRVHPEPADDCPCFDDSVAFAGVMIGVELGHWHYAFSGWAWDFPVLGTVPFRFADIGWTRSVLRIALGVVTIFAWREAMKPALLRVLPPIFRILENLGLNLPRRFFVQAS